MLHTAPQTPARRSVAVPLAALSLFACFLLALAGHGLQPAASATGKVAFSNRDAGVATIPRQGAPVRVASASQREHAKSPFASGALGLPCFTALAVLAGTGPREFLIASAQLLPVDIAHFPRGPPARSS